MKTIAICNHKGGVGKTALSMAIAEGLHRKGKRTLLVDLDQQMNATQQAKIDTTDEVTVYDLLTSFDYTAKDGIKHFDGGDIIPGDVLVSNAESDMAKLDTRLTMLADAMEGIDDESVADACSTSVPAIYSLAKGDNPRRAKYDKNADVIGYNLRLPANIHRLLKRHCMETNESMNNVVLVALYRDMKNWEDLAPCPHCGAILPVGAQFCPDCGKEI